MTISITVELITTVIGVSMARFALHRSHRASPDPHDDELWHASTFLTVVGLIITLTSWGIGLK